METFKKKILIIGLDGASWSLFDNILESGYMPYLKKLKNEGAYGSILSTIPPISPAAWGTIQTGIDAINNHVYEFYCFNKANRSLQIVNSNFLKNTIWEILSIVGKRVGIVNVPMTYPPKKVNGYIVSGILTPSLDSNFTYPPNLRDVILKKIPNYQLHYSEDIRYGNPHYNIKEFIRQRMKNVKDRTKICLYLINNYKFDIFMVNFQANDILQHVLWGYMEENNRLYCEDIKLYIFKHFHTTLDLCIQTLREEFIRKSNSDLLTIILSDHGCETHTKRFFLGDWLYQQNLLKIKKNIINLYIIKKLKDLLLKITISKFQAKLMIFLKKIKNKSKGLKKFEQETTFFQNIIDWENSYSFSMGISNYGLIFILKKGEEKDKVINFLKNKLYQIKDPEFNLNIVERVYIKEELYNGNRPELIPDIIIKPKKGYSFTGLFQNKKNLFQKIRKKSDFAIGKHNEEGILIIHGQSVSNTKIKNAHLKDIVPTILNYFHLPIIDYLNGKILNYFKV
ncbi:MAG: alkaline phosphatase family protein [Promethearchaeota archaeon]